MRKITFLLSLLVSVWATAQVTVPQVSTATEKHYYKLISRQSPKYCIATNGGGFKSSNIEASTLFSFEAVDGEEGIYYIKSATYDAYISAADLGSGQAIKWMQGTPTDTEKWKLKTNGDYVTFVTYATKDAADASQLGWNQSGGAGGNIVLYASAAGNTGTYWTMVEKDPPAAPDFVPVKASEITSGWYQMQVVNGFNGEAWTSGKYVLNTPAIVGRNTWTFSLHAMNNVSSTFFYFEEDPNNSGKFAIKNCKGQYATANGVSTSATPVYEFSFVVDNGTSATINGVTYTPSDDGTETKILIKATNSSGTVYQHMGWYSSGDQSVFVGVSSTNGGNFPGKSFEISKISDEYLAQTYYVYDVETLDFEPVHGNVGAQYNATDYSGVRLAYPGGAFFVRKDRPTPPQASDFALNQGGMDVSRDNHFLFFDVNTEDPTIRITQTLTASAEDVLDLSENNKVGFPESGMEEPNAKLRTALETAKRDGLNTANLTALETAYNTWKTEVANLESDVVMPEDGKAYYLRNVQKRLPKSYYMANNENGEIVLKPYSAEKDLSNIFICHKVGDKYMFTNAAKGNYMVWKGNGSGYNDNKGYSESYVSQFCDFNVIAQPSSRPGSFRLVSKRNDNDKTDGSFVVFTANGRLDGWGNSVCWENTYTNSFVFEEVKDYEMNNVTLKTPATTDGYNYASLYLPYATTIPEGVEAFSATLSNDKQSMTLAAIEGTTLPKNTAVVLRSANETAATFVPAIEPGTEPTTNSLMGTVDATAATPAGTFVLSGAFGEIGFYKYTASTLPAGKAYLESADSAVQGLLFGDGNVTGIEAVETGNDDKAAYYDLSGRRVEHPATGIYVRGGKKVFVK